MRKGLLTLALVLTAMLQTAWAYDFSATSPSGHTLYYEIISGTTNVGVVRPGTSSAYNNYVAGNVVIPATVVYNNTTYNVTELRSIYNGSDGYDYGSFESCSGLTSVTIPNSVTSIGDYAFEYCSGLTSVTIPNSVTSIGQEAFRGCTGLTSVTIPNSVTSIGSYAFYLVKNIIYNGTATGSPWGALSHNGFIEDDFIYADSTKTVLEAYIGTSTSVTIPNSVTSIGNYAFYNCTGLTSVTIPNSVTTIGEGAFYNCSGLTSVTIPNSVTSIGMAVFYNCSGLTSVTIPNSITFIDQNTFGYCTSLTSLVIPNNVTFIHFRAFYNCSNLTLIVPNSVTEIYRDAFLNVKLVIYNGNSTGSPWGASRVIRADGVIENEFIYSDSTKTWLVAYVGTVTNVTIPNSVITIGRYSFENCSGLTSVTIPNSVTSIGIAAFCGCSGLTSVTIPNSVTSIGNNAFYNCSGLTSVTIGNSVTSIGNLAFCGYSGLTTLNFNAINCGDFNNDSFHPFSNCPIATINIGDSVQRIPAYFAYDLDSLTSVTIGNSVTSIGDDAFYNCSGLTSVTIGNSVTSIGVAAFCGCSGLTSVTIGNSVTSIGEDAFWGCSGLTSVTIPNSVTTIEEGAFYECSGLTSATIGNSVTSIGNYAFRGCTGLTSITIPNSVTTIDKSAFRDCGHLASATISSGINRIEESTFENCTSLVTITIPSNVANIEDKAFNGCSSLHEVISLAVLPPSLGEEIFSATAILKVPCGSADYYNSAASDWTQYFVGIEEICNVTITVTSANESMGTVSGGGEYEFGTEVTITATPNQGYRFASWNDGNTDNPRTITVTEDATYIATFEEAVGIESKDMLSELAFYPNPTSGIITFNRSDIMKVEVLDAMGRTVEVYENAYTIDISKLAKGYYAMRITTAEGVAVRKVIRK